MYGLAGFGIYGFGVIRVSGFCGVGLGVLNPKPKRHLTDQTPELSGDTDVPKP